MNMRRIYPLLVLIPAKLTQATTLPAQSQQAKQAELRPEDLLSRAIGRDAYGPVRPVPRSGRLQLFVNEQPLAGEGALVPVPPGAEIRLRAVSNDSPTTAATTTTPARLMRRTRHEEILWLSSVGNTLLAGDRGDVIFRPEPNSIDAVRVTASVASLEVFRTNAGSFSPDETVPAPLTAASVSVLLLPGVPFDRAGDGLLAGQNIGIYPNEASDKAPIAVRDRAELYRPPTAFYLLDATTGGLLVTPHRTLAQLHPPVIGTAEVPRMVPLSDRLLKFLTAFEQRLESRGMNPANLRVLRGFVSPTERLRLQGAGENLAPFSRFLYGDAVALVYSPDGKGVMGDFDANGATDLRDVQAMGDVAKETMDSLKIYGGLGIAKKYPGEGPAKGQPYLHVDLRGFYAPFTE